LVPDAAQQKLARRAMSFSGENANSRSRQELVSVAFYFSRIGHKRHAARTRCGKGFSHLQRYHQCGLLQVKKGV
jgi:hypothetical protein